jgi:hypothetical protein
VADATGDYQATDGDSPINFNVHYLNLIIEAAKVFKVETNNLAISEAEERIAQTRNPPSIQTMSISMALFSPPTHPPSLSPSISPKTHLTLKPHFSLRSPKTPFFLLSTTRASADNGAGTSASAAAALQPEAGQKVAEPPQPVIEKDESSAGANGSAVAAEAVEIKVVSKFEDPRWVQGTWDLKQFEKDGKPDWDAVIDAGEVLGLC